MSGGELPIKTDEPYRCTRDCKNDDGSWRGARRAQRGCTRVDLPRVEWDIDLKKLLLEPTRRADIFFGQERKITEDERRRIRRVSSGINPEKIEDPEQGCPAGWYYTRFVNSVFPYLRRRTSSGGRVDNPRFNAAPPVVQRAVLYFEDQQEEAERSDRLLEAERWDRKAKREQAKKKAHPRRGRRRR